MNTILAIIQHYFVICKDGIIRPRTTVHTAASTAGEGDNSTPAQKPRDDRSFIEVIEDFLTTHESQPQAGTENAKR